MPEIRTDAKMVCTVDNGMRRRDFSTLSVRT